LCRINGLHRGHCKINVFPPWPLLSAFLVASLLLAVSPGPGVFYVVTRSLTQGPRAGLASVAGVALGNLLNALAASIGLAALFALSAMAFTLVKLAGAAYLIHLGIGALRWPRAKRPLTVAGTAPLARIFRDGFLVALLNPKTAIFFGAFLPQFLSTGPTSVVQCATLGSLFVAIAATTDSAYALSASAVAPALGRVRALGAAGRYFTAGALIGLGIFAAIGRAGGTK
jgi:threonine/homoserine/homoserine lactone efflux protein